MRKLRSRPKLYRISHFLPPLPRGSQLPSPRSSTRSNSASPHQPSSRHAEAQSKQHKPREQRERSRRSQSAGNGTAPGPTAAPAFAIPPASPRPAPPSPSGIQPSSPEPRPDLVTPCRARQICARSATGEAVRAPEPGQFRGERRRPQRAGREAGDLTCARRQGKGSRTRVRDSGNPLLKARRAGRRAAEEDGGRGGGRRRRRGAGGARAPVLCCPGRVGWLAGLELRRWVFLLAAAAARRKKRWTARGGGWAPCSAAALFLASVFSKKKIYITPRLWREGVLHNSPTYKTVNIILWTF